ncbi:MAG TPA: TatD family hydrolase [Stellaceae bacterium]|nr:TatD family hydrolase [Stellaceae bacterium]
MMLVDSHCHLDYLPAGPVRAETIARARRAGVGAMLTIGTKITEFPAVRAIAEENADVWCSAGIHPHEAEAEPETPAERLASLAAHPKVVGIGETGLDFYYEHSPRERQVEVFRAHAAAARATGLPLIVHTRDADPETASVLAEEAAKGPLTGVIHCFSTGRELAENALKIGFYISLSGIVTFKNAEPLRAIVRDLPLDRMLVETDAPYLAPVPLRGKQNEPAFIVYTAAEVARLKGLSIDELARITTANFFRLFAKATAPAAPRA